MSRYIDADALDNRIKAEWAKQEDDNGYGLAHFFVETQPTADVIHVVFCKDCVHRDPEDKKCDGSFSGRCGVLPMDDYDFCSYGETDKEVKHNEQ